MQNRVMLRYCSTIMSEKLVWFAGEVKVVVVGNGCVGKTSMIRQFCKGQYSNEYKKTIGVDFLEKHQYVVPPLVFASFMNI